MANIVKKSKYKYTRSEVVTFYAKIKKEHPDFFTDDHMPWSIGIGDFFRKIYTDIDQVLIDETLTYITKMKRGYLRSFLFNEYRYNLETQSYAETINPEAVKLAFTLLKSAIKTDKHAYKTVNICKNKQEQLLQNKLLSEDDKSLILAYIDSITERTKYLVKPMAIPQHKKKKTPLAKKPVTQVRKSKKPQQVKKICTPADTLKNQTTIETKQAGPKILIKKKLTTQQTRIIEIVGDD